MVFILKLWQVGHGLASNVGVPQDATIGVLMPLTLARPADSELLIKKSRFIGRVQPMGDRAGAQKVVAELWAQHSTASHVCWALIAGGQSAAVDDGEPSGTAGRPMLEVLRHQNMEGVLATVVRYYGGINLGAGGLVRAYTDCVAQALLVAEKVAIVKQTALRCTFPYALEGLVRRELEVAGVTLDDVQHAELVDMSFKLPQDTAKALVAHLNEAGHGRITWLSDDPSPS
jgi:uncharacterized YigZ family protein